MIVNDFDFLESNDLLKDRMTSFIIHESTQTNQ